MQFTANRFLRIAVIFKESFNHLAFNYASQIYKISKIIDNHCQGLQTVTLSLLRKLFSDKKVGLIFFSYTACAVSKDMPYLAFDLYYQKSATHFDVTNIMITGIFSKNMSLVCILRIWCCKVLLSTMSFHVRYFNILMIYHMLR